MRAEERLATLNHLDWLGKHIIPRTRKIKNGYRLSNGEFVNNGITEDEPPSKVQVQPTMVAQSFTNDSLNDIIKRISAPKLDSKESNEHDVDRNNFPVPVKDTSRSDIESPVVTPVSVTLTERVPLYTPLVPTAHARESAMDEYDLFGQYVATKLRKLSQVMSDHSMEAVEYDITTVLMKARMKTANTQENKVP